AHESSAMLVRATKAASRFAAGLCAGAGIFAGADYVNKMSQTEEMWRDSLEMPGQASSERASSEDISEKEAQEIYNGYKRWADQYNKFHESLTSEWRNRGVQRRSKEELSNEIKGEVRECTLEEKTKFKNILCEYGFSEEESSEIVEKIFIINSFPFSYDKIYNGLILHRTYPFSHEALKGIRVYSVSGSLPSNPIFAGVYNTDIFKQKDAFVFPYNVVLEIMLNNKAAIQTLLHECMHYKYCPGHQIHTLIYTNKLDTNRLREEQRADVESLRRMSSKDLTDSSFDKPFLLKLNHIDSIKVFLAQGYVSCSKHIRDLVIADAVEREQLQEAQELLEKLQKVEKAERADAVEREQLQEAQGLLEKLQKVEKTERTERV
ncbi:hypothetical protein EBQ93_01520, partial [bacterium]|nr:hypothetical protein [bacterium]